MSSTNGTPPRADVLPPRTVAYTVRLREPEARKLLEFARALDKSPTGFATDLLHSAIQAILITPVKARSEQTTIDDLLRKKRALSAAPKKKTAKRAPKKK